MDLDHKSLAERVAILESQREYDRILLNDIKLKLDELLELKHKGMGAIGLVGLIIGSGVIGLAFTIWNMLRGPHLP
jgi:hypothetical protein